jgi:hypothetical protein
MNTLGKSLSEKCKGAKTLLSLLAPQKVSSLLLFNTYLHCVQTDPAKNVWTRAYLFPERNRTGRRQEELLTQSGRNRNKVI